MFTTNAWFIERFARDCHRKISIDILHIPYIFYILKTSHVFVNQYYNPDIEIGTLVSICYMLLLFYNGQRFFRIYFEWIFYRTLAEKLATLTKFEVKRHFTIRAGCIADTCWIKFVFFSYQYLQNFSVSDQNPSVAGYQR